MPWRSAPGNPPISSLQQPSSPSTSPLITPTNNVPNLLDENVSHDLLLGSFVTGLIHTITVHNKPPIELNLLPTSVQSPKEIKGCFDNKENDNTVRSTPKPERTGQGACPNDNESKYLENGDDNKKPTLATNSEIFAIILGYMDDTPTTLGDTPTEDDFTRERDASKKVKKTLDCKHEWKEVCTICESVRKPHTRECKKKKVTLCTVCKKGAVVIHEPIPRPTSPPKNSLRTVVKTTNNIINYNYNFYVLPEALPGLDIKSIQPQANNQQGPILQKQKTRGRFREKWQSFKRKIAKGYSSNQSLKV